MHNVQCGRVQKASLLEVQADCMANNLICNGDEFD